MRRVVEGSSSLQQSDFDYHVRQYLHALYHSGGKERLREALAMIQSAIAKKDRQAIKKWPAYLLTLLKRFDADQASQDREARARARVATAAAGGTREPADSVSPKADSVSPKALPLQLLPSSTPDPAHVDPLSLDSPLGGSMGEPWSSWGLPAAPQSPVAAR